MRLREGGAVSVIAPEHLREIIGAAADIALILDEAAIIQSILVSPSAEGFGNLSHWEGHPLPEFLAQDSVARFRDAFDHLVTGKGLSKPTDLSHQDGTAWEYLVRYSMHRFGENTVLLMGRDLRPITETQHQLVQAQIALEQRYEEQRASDSRYRIMLNKTREAVLMVNLPDGRISDCSDAAAALLGLKRDEVLHSTLAHLLSDRSPPELMESLLTASLPEGSGTVEVTAERSELRLIIEPSLFRAGGQRILHCMLRTTDQMPRIADAETLRAMALFRTARDAILFTDFDGAILSSNKAFLELLGAAHSGDIRGKSLGDFLTRGQIDMSVLVDTARRSGHIRLYATKLTSVLGTRLSVEISATRLDDPATPILAFMIRDAARVEAARTTPNARMGEDSDVMALVGNASLKEIVAQTTDVVEKMCIETAVHLTGNNRVAAAEMLGLSRQSLYVKLRKYGLVNKTD